MSANSETEAKIIQAARDVFLHKGKAGARLQDIADVAGINKALLHYYFRSKDRLYEKVFEQIVSDFLSEFLDSFSTDEDFRETLKSFIDKYLTALSKHPEVVRFVMWEIKEGGVFFAEQARGMFASRGFETIPLISVIQKAVAEGRIRPVDPVQLTISIIGMCLYPFIAQPLLEKIIPGIEVQNDDFLSRRSDEIFDLVWRGVGLA